ncbi:MAG: DUF3619 family protein [Halieaceae bacterium]|nr:DUF3619 family protein [Halieaceae bacterium]
MREVAGKGRLDEQEIEQLARQALQQSLAGMNAETRSRLNQARNQALAAQSRPAPWRGWVPVGAAACAALVFAITLPFGASQVAQYVDPGLIMPELVAEIGPAALEDTELLENLDMMLWLIEVENHAS